MRKQISRMVIHSIRAISWTAMIFLAGQAGFAQGNQTPDTEPHPAEPTIVFVEGGTFWMGCSDEQGDDCWTHEAPLRSITLSDFYIGKYEVTQAQWKLLMDSNPSKFKGDSLPVENVSWHDTQEFIKRLRAATGKNYRLPTEAEWEYAARGGLKSKGYPYSGSHDVGEVAWHETNSGYSPRASWRRGKISTHPVGMKKANELGIHDMSGNVWEWCHDWYGSYNDSTQNNPAGASSGSERVYRGGGWLRGKQSCRIAGRNYGLPDTRNSNLGFRLVYTPD